MKDKIETLLKEVIAVREELDKLDQLYGDDLEKLTPDQKDELLRTFVQLQKLRKEYYTLLGKELRWSKEELSSWLKETEIKEQCRECK